MNYKKKVKKEVTTPVVLSAVVVKKIPVKIETKIEVESLVTRSKKCLRQLKAMYGVFKQAVPLELGIAKTIYQAHPQYSHRVVNSALYLHTHHIKYLNSIIKQAVRYSLRGEEISIVDDKSKELAKATMKQIRSIKKGNKAKSKKPS